MRPMVLPLFNALLLYGVDASPRADEPVATPEVTTGEKTELSLRPKPIAPPDPAELEGSIRRGVAFLLADQNPDGSWGSAERTKDLNIYAPAPGSHLAFRTGVTALCISALSETAPHDPAAQTALDKAETWLFAHLPKLRRATPDALYNIWGHAYAIEALVLLLPRHPDDLPRNSKIRELIGLQFQALEAYESVDGGWGYYDFRGGMRKPASSSTSFMNATVLVVFQIARRAGFPPPPKLVERAIAATKRQMKNDYSYIYGEYLKYQPMHPVNRPGGSLGRSQACNLALRIWGEQQITDEVLKSWLDRLITRNLWLDIGRKRPVPHESWFAVAGYFYYYGHYYGALCIDELPRAERPLYQAHLARILMRLQEKDGSWWDYPLYNYHQQYGTAFAIMSLQRCRTLAAPNP